MGLLFCFAKRVKIDQKAISLRPVLRADYCLKRFDKGPPVGNASKV